MLLMFNAHNQTQRLIDSARVHCMYNYPAGSTSHHLHRYNVHLLTVPHVSLASLTKASCIVHHSGQLDSALLTIVESEKAAKHLSSGIYTCV